MKQLMRISPILAAIAILGGCASAPVQQARSPSYPAASAPSYAVAYGTVDSIKRTSAAPAGTSGVGAVVGGVVGGLLGNQVGGGSGKKIATVAGVVGGAVAGNQVEQYNKAQPQEMYQIAVRLDNRSYQTYEQDSIGDLHVGSRARVENGRVYRN